MAQSPALEAHLAPQPFVGPVLVGGFAMAVATWCAAFITHLPALDLPGRVAGPTVLVVWGLAALVFGTWLSQRRAAGIGLAAGALSSILGLLILGSMLTEQPVQGVLTPSTGGLHAGAALAAAGFIAFGTVLGGACALAGALLRRRAVIEPNWVGRFGMVTVAAVIPLLVVGGAVTSHNAGMAIKGWPTSDTANMFLYPISLMVSDAGRFYEHTHRLFGTLVGLCAIVLMIYVLVAAKRPAVKIWAVAFFLLVLSQGILGGLRVLEDSRYAALLHGVAAQLIFGVAIAVAAFLSPTYQSLVREGAPHWSTRVDGARKLRGFATGLFHAMVLQLALGATFRHLKFEGSPGAMHALYAHAAFSLIVTGHAIAAGLYGMRAGRSVLVGRPRLGQTLIRAGSGALFVVGVQFALGWGAFLAVLSAPRSGEGQVLTVTPVQALITNSHQANGALLLALATVLLVFSRRIASRGGTGTPAPPHA
ncbi:MAG: COX15/CtaA family protein [Phycisphaerales bacterium]|nr:COX15/CtaA family protein [Phycisphaerales bacterium]